MRSCFWLREAKACTVFGVGRMRRARLLDVAAQCGIPLKAYQSLVCLIEAVTLADELLSSVLVQDHPRIDRALDAECKGPKVRFDVAGDALHGRPLSCRDH